MSLEKKLHGRDTAYLQSRQEALRAIVHRFENAKGRNARKRNRAAEELGVIEIILEERIRIEQESVHEEVVQVVGVQQADESESPEGKDDVEFRTVPEVETINFSNFEAVQIWYKEGLDLLVNRITQSAVSNSVLEKVLKYHHLSLPGFYIYRNGATNNQKKAFARKRFPSIFLCENEDGYSDIQHLRPYGPSNKEAILVHPITKLWAGIQLHIAQATMRTGLASAQEHEIRYRDFIKNTTDNYTRFEWILQESESCTIYLLIDNPLANHRLCR